MSDHLARIDPQNLPEVERLRALIGTEIYTDHLSNALAAFARGEGRPAPTRACCGVSIEHDHGDCDGYIFTAADYWRGIRVAFDEEAAEHLEVLFGHGIYKDHCNGYEIHAWPCFPASLVLCDLRDLVGHDLWLRTDFFGGTR